MTGKRLSAEQVKVTSVFMGDVQMFQLIPPSFLVNAVPKHNFFSSLFETMGPVNKE